MSEFNEDTVFILKVTRARLLKRQKSGDKIYPETIRQELENIAKLFPEESEHTDLDACHEELIRQFSIWTGTFTTLQDNREHIAWLTADRKRDWRYWPRHREWLESKGRACSVIENLDESTDEILGLLEDPLRTGGWDRRGLVVGHVQSGKTGNYAALICKAADAGYKIIIVLAGMHNSLRSQTQQRLEEDFLGFTTDENNLKGIVGAGQFDQDSLITPNCGTSLKESGDFRRQNVTSFSVSPEIRPWLFVVKKNKSVLENIVKWLKSIAKVTDPAADRKIIPDFPLLLIDDEADNASVDTARDAVRDDKANEEHDPRKINKLIRTILGYFGRKAYVGYTATPFANIFIHDQAYTTDEGRDLYPSSFILNLGTPSNYIGPVKVFANQDYGRAIIRQVTDYAVWMPSPHRSDHNPLTRCNDIPDSLKKAVQAFILCCAARRCRGEGTQHCSMLVHVTRFTAVQKVVHDQVRDYLKNIQRRIHRHIGSDEILESLRTLWESDFLPNMALFKNKFPEDAGASVSWHQIEEVLDPVVMDIEIKSINGRAKDVLDYANHKETGYKVIAVGGDKLSRGLTLEGLAVSYFLRTSRMYDSLMQMGRWFGYRPGYADLCRLYTTEDLCDSYRHVTEATSELRAEFELMAASGGTPKDFGLKVRTHPTLLVTSPLKMQAAHDIQVSFSGTMPETVTFLSEKDARQRNLSSLSRFILSLGKPEINPSREQHNALSRKTWNGFFWQDVASSAVMDWLEEYASPLEACRTNPARLVEFIRSMNEVSELTTWDIYLNNSGKNKTIRSSVANLQVVRALRRKESVSSRFSIKRLLGANEEELLLDGKAWRAALALARKNREETKDGTPGTVPEHPSGPAIRKICGFGASGIEARPDCGLLILYLVDVYENNMDNLLTQDIPLVGFAMSFPGSDKGKTVTYKATSVLWREEYGEA